MKQLFTFAFLCVSIVTSALFFFPLSSHACTQLDTNLFLSSRGPSVTALQQFLETQGFLDPVQVEGAYGFFGNLTQLAVMKYQSARGIDPTGFVGPLTRAQIGAETCLSGGNAPAPSLIIDTPIEKVDGVSLSLQTNRRSGAFTDEERITLILTAKNTTNDDKFIKLRSVCDVWYEIGTYKSNDQRVCVPQAETITLWPNRTYEWEVFHRPGLYKLPVGPQTITMHVAGVGSASVGVNISKHVGKRFETGTSTGGQNSNNNTGGPVPFDTSFVVFDGVGGYRNKPNPFHPGAKMAHLAGGGKLFSGSHPNYNDTAGDEQTVRTYVRTLPQNAVVVINIEHWPLNIRNTPTAQVDESMRKFLDIFSWFRSERPDVKIGVYSMFPGRDYWTPVNNRPAEMAAWRAANEYLRPLANAVDYIFPSIYTFYNDPNGWEVYARANIREAQIYGKPVYPFLWPTYHDSTVLRGQSISREFMRRQYDVMRSAGANGFVVWEWAPHVQWTNTFPWFQELDDFIGDNNLGPRLTSTVYFADAIPPRIALQLSGLITVVLAAYFLIRLYVRRIRLESTRE